MKFYIKQKVFSFGDSFNIYDENGREAFYVQGRVFSLGKKLNLYDNQSNELIYMEQKLFKLMPTYDIYASNRLMATIKKNFTFFSQSFTINSAYGSYEVEGDFTGHDFDIVKNGTTFCASLCKRWLSFGDSYEIEIAPEENIPFMLAMVIVIDQTIHEDNN